MVVDKRFEPPDLVTATLCGVASSRDRADLIGWARSWIRRIGPVRVLIRLEAFGGWSADESLDAGSSWLQEDDRIVKMAIIGRKEWRHVVLTFLTPSLRRLPIAYFQTEHEARIWLASNAPADPALVM